MRYTKEDCVRLLRDKGEELAGRGVERPPQRSDFEDEEVVAIKAFLGPWPRALEKAGLKEPRGVDGPERNREKRRRARRRARLARKGRGTEESHGEG